MAATTRSPCFCLITLGAKAVFDSPCFYVANLGQEACFPGSFRVARQHIRPLPRRRLPQGAVIPNLGAGLPSRAALRGRPPSTLAPPFPSGRRPNPSGQRPFCVCPPFDDASPVSVILALSRKGELLCRAPAAAAVIVWASSADVSSVPECLEPGLGLMLCQEKRIPVASGPRNEPCGKNLGFL